MAAIFFMDKSGEVYIISNNYSVMQAGFKPVKSYYNRFGDELTYYIRDDGTVLERLSAPRRQTINNIYQTTDDANKAFRKRQSYLRTWDEGRYVPKKN